MYCDPTPLDVASCHIDDDLDVASGHIDDDESRLFQDESTICCCGSLDDSMTHKDIKCADSVVTAAVRETVAQYCDW